jgi:O-antigen/teichoic acid export membrane protein
MRADVRRLAGGSLVYGIGSVLLRGLSFFLLPLYTSYLSPADYGVLAIATAVTAVLAVIYPLGLHGAVTRMYFETNDVRERRERVGAIWQFMVIAGLAMTLMVQLIGGWVFERLFVSVPFLPYGLLATWTAFANMLGVVPLMLLQIEERSRRYVAMTAVTTLVTVGSIIWFVVVNRLGASGYLLGAFVGSMVMALPFVVMTWRWVRLAPRWDVVRAALRYGLPLVPHGLASWTLELSDRAILQRFVSLAQVGLYSLAYQFGTIMNVVASAINNAWIPFVFRRVNEQGDAAKPGLARLATYFAFVIVWTGLGLSLLVEDAISFLTTPPFHAAAEFAPWIIFGCMFQSLYFVPGNFILARGRTSRIAIVTLVSGAMNVTLILLLAPRFGVIAAAWATFASYLLMLGLAWGYGQQAFAIPYEYSRLVRVALAAGGLFAAGTLVADHDMPLRTMERIAIWAAFPGALAILRFYERGEVQTVGDAIRGFRARITP